MRKIYFPQKLHALHKLRKIQDGDGVNILLAKVVMQAYKDLQFFVKSPVVARKEFKRCSTNAHQLMKFWECYAEDILVYLIGRNKTSLIIKKIEPFLEEAKKIHLFQRIKNKCKNCLYM